MKKKLLIFIFCVLIIILISVLIIKSNQNNNNQNTNKTGNSILNENTTSNVNSNGENAGIWVGTKENFLLISVKINKKGSKVDQAKELISKISKATGYNMVINSLDINEKNIKVDLSKAAAPFSIADNYSDSTDIQFYISSDELVEKTLLQSIDKTLTSYFGKGYTVTITADSEEINF